VVLVKRPPLIVGLETDEFGRHYWLKAELLEFCRDHRLSTAGSKRELEAGIARFLETGERTERVQRTKRAAMPEMFTLETVIEDGWWCGEALGAFLETQVGRGFRFDGAMREFVRHGEGKTLQETVAYWHESRVTARARKPISEQFEYNRFTRAYFDEHPGANRQQVIAAWYAHRNREPDSSQDSASDARMNP
jgi:hypothetical protein